MMKFQSRVLLAMWAVPMNMYSTNVMAFVPYHPFSKCSWITNPSSSCYRNNHVHQMSAVIKSSSSKPKSKNISPSISTSSSPSSSTASDYDSINKLTFRGLQRACRDNGLVSTGSTATLRNRLLEFHGISLHTGTNTPKTNDNALTSSIPEEVCLCSYYVYSFF